VAEGAPNKRSRPNSAISIKTVEKHRQQLMTNSTSTTPPGLTRHAIADGVLLESSIQ